MDQSSIPGGNVAPSQIRHTPGLGQPAAPPRPASPPAGGNPPNQPKQGAPAPTQRSPGAAPISPPAPVQRPAVAHDEGPDLSPVKMAAGEGQAKKEIRAFGGLKRHVDEWSRTPNVTGQGAIHVKTFHGKLTEDALVYMDRQINEWLDAHPEYEIKFVSSSIGEFSGKIKEPNLICQVWV